MASNKRTIPEIGSMAKDEATRRCGEVMATTGEIIYLRPLRGGKEWTARAEDVVPITQTETLSARVALANRRSREGV